MKKVKKIVKALGIAVLLIAMAYASNWDLPKQTWEEAHQEELKAYEETRGQTHRIEIDGDIYEGVYIDGMWYEPLEVYGGAIPEEYMEGGNQ